VNQIGAYHVSQTNPFTFNVVQDWQDLSVGWHHVGLVFEEGVGSSLYIDGVLSDADSTVTAGVAEYQRRFSIGGQDYSTARPFAGGIDDAILYPRAPSPTEISAIYAGNAPSGAALHWEFDSIDLPPADVPDLSGNNRDGYFTVEGPTAVNDGTGPHEGYLMLDGTGFVNSGWKPSELTGSYTVAAWFQGHDAAATNETVFGSYSDGANPGFVLQFVGDPRHGDDQLVAYHVTTTSPFTYATVKSPESYHDGWHHAVLVFEEGIGLRLYVDGAKVAEDASVTEGVSQFPVAFSAGGQNYTAQRPFTAGLDEVLVFDTAFSDAQVLDLYNNNTATGALLHWAFDADAQNLPGDLNGDGTVGSADLDIVRANWGATVEPGCLSCGDPSGDGSVGSADLDIIRANWGATAAAAVPEPSGLALLALSGMVLAGLGSRRGRK